MSNPIIREHNTETDEVIDREMTDAEAADFAQAVEIIENAKTAAAAKEATKAAVLAKLGLTAEELAALI